MSLLRHRPRSEREARTRLARQGFAPEDVDRTIARAADEGMIDDALFAKLWVDDRLLHRPMARRAIEFELRDKGVDEPIIRAALDAAYPPSQEKDVAWRLARERFERLAALDPVKRARRVVDYLLRKGFPRSLSIGIVSEMERQEPDE